MAKFQFSLEVLLEARRREERDRQIEVAEIEARRRELEGAIRSRHTAARAGREDLRRALEPGAARSMAGVRLQAGVSIRLEAQMQGLAIELAGVLKTLEDARERLLEASRARKAVELLREKRFEEWKREQDRREARELDDLTSGRYARELATNSAEDGTAA